MRSAIVDITLADGKRKTRYSFTFYSEFFTGTYDACSLIPPHQDAMHSTCVIHGNLDIRRTKICVHKHTRVEHFLHRILRPTHTYTYTRASVTVIY